MGWWWGASGALAGSGGLSPAWEGAVARWADRCRAHVPNGTEVDLFEVMDAWWLRGQNKNLLSRRPPKPLLANGNPIFRFWLTTAATKKYNTPHWPDVIGDLMELSADSKPPIYTEVSEIGDDGRAVMVSFSCG